MQFLYHRLPKSMIGERLYDSYITSDSLVVLDIPHSPDAQQTIVGGSLKSSGTILQVAEAMVRLPDGKSRPTGAKFLITDKASIHGFSGGPAVVEGKVIGIQKAGVDSGSFGVLSSAENIETMTKRKACQ